MKKFKMVSLIVLFCVVINIVFQDNVRFSFGITYGASETKSYAKALSNCYLYKTSSMSDDLENIYFIVPETYFVLVNEIISDDCISVSYGNYVGYVKSSTIVIATFVPVVKTLEGITCDLKETAGTQIWSLPTTTNSTTLTIIPAGTSGITYIASTYGTIPNGGESNVWYFVRYIPDSNSTNVYEGYIYSENVASVTEIVPNTESNPEVSTGDEDGDDTLYISSTFKTILIAVIVIPVILFFAIILYNLVKKLSKFTNKQKVQNKNFYDENSNYLGENNFYSNNFQNNLSASNGFDSEHQSIEKFTNKTFVKKSNLPQRNNLNYPRFPSYDNDDDLL